MKIVDVRTVIVDGGWRNWVFVMVETDEGLTGYGECTLEGRELAVVGVVQDFRRHLVGEDPDHIRRLCASWPATATGRAARSSVRGSAGWRWRSGTCLARALGLSVASLLGRPGPGGYEVYSNAWYFGAESSEEFAKCALRDGRPRVPGTEVRPFRSRRVHLERPALGRSIERVEAVRDAVGTTSPS